MMSNLMRGIISRTVPPSSFLNRCTFYTSSKRMVATDLIMPTNFQRRILVWTKFYPSLVDVPRNVTMARLKKSMDLFRIRVSLFMFAFFVGAMYASAIMGRRLRDAGDTATVRAESKIREWQEAGRIKRAKVETVKATTEK